MSLIGNYAVISKTPGRFLSGTALSGARSNFNKSGMNRNKFLSLANFSSVPNGYIPGYAFVPAQKAGGIATYKYIDGTISTTSSLLASGVSIVAGLSGVGTITSANLSQIFNMIAALTASGTISNANMSRLSLISAGLSATGTITAADLTFLTQYAIAAALSASGNITNAQMGAIISMIAALSAEGHFTNIGDFATANMSANISSSTPLSPESLAASLWNSVAADYNTAGTMGEKLNDAGSASNPWTEVIESGYTAEEILRILLAYAAGETTIVSTGTGTATVVFKSQDGTKSRIDADMTNSERTTITLDPS